MISVLPFRDMDVEEDAAMLVDRPASIVQQREERCGGLGWQK